MDMSSTIKDFNTIAPGIEASEQLDRLVRAAGMATAHTGLQR